MLYKPGQELSLAGLFLQKYECATLKKSKYFLDVCGNLLTMLTDKKYQFFISSTYTDLIEERDVVIKNILTLYQFPIGMEMFSAGDEDQWETIKKTIDSSDYYILILGERYGSVSPTGLGFTEMEYDYALTQHIPICSLVKEANLPSTPAQRESDPELMKRYTDFRKKVLENSKMAAFWRNKDDLGGKALAAITKAMVNKPRMGWIKATQSLEVATQELSVLSKENRELREEVETLKGLLVPSIPDLSFEFIDNPCSLNHTTFRNTFLRPINPQKLSSETVFFITRQEIERYNNELESAQDEIQAYFTACNVYENAKNNSVSLSAVIANVGTIKANEIFVDIDYPESCSVMPIEVIKELPFPKPPNIKNPLTAYVKKKNGFDRFDRLEPPSRPFLDIKIPSISNRSKKYFHDKKKRKVTYSIPTLLHTRNQEIKEGLFLVPLSEGNFDLTITIMCQEWKEPIKQTFPISIEGNKPSTGDDSPLEFKPGTFKKL